MLCDEAREHLSAYLDKELSAHLSAAVRAHLDTCADCRKVLEELRATADLLGRLPVRAAPEGLARDVMREMERRSILEPRGAVQGQPHERTLALARARTWPRALAIAATFLLAAGIGVFAWLANQAEMMSAPSARSPAVVFNVERSLAEEVETRREAEEASPEAAHFTSAGKKRWAAGETPDAYGLDGDSKAGVGVNTLGERQEKADARPARGLARASTTGLANLEDVAGQQAIFGNEQVVRPAPTAQGLAPAGVTIVDDQVRVATADLGLVRRGTADRLRFQSNGAAVRYLDGGTVGLEEVAKLGHTDMADLFVAPESTVAAGLGKAGPDTAYPVVAATQDGPRMVQTMMNSVALGQAAVDDLRAVATPTNLDHADNQLVVRTASRVEANKELVRLFGANNWEELPATQADRSSGRETGRGMRGALAESLDEAGAKAAAKAGVYFLASRNGADTWVVLTDRDNLSRFGAQLAQATTMTVGMDSSTLFQAIGRLQNQLRAHGDLARAEGESWGRSVGKAGAGGADEFKSRSFGYSTAGHEAHPADGLSKGGSADRPKSPAKKAEAPPPPAEKPAEPPAATATPSWGDRADDNATQQKAKSAEPPMMAWVGKRPAKEPAGEPAGRAQRPATETRDKDADDLAQMAEERQVGAQSEVAKQESAYISAVGVKPGTPAPAAQAEMAPDARQAGPATVHAKPSPEPATAPRKPVEAKTAPDRNNLHARAEKRKDGDVRQRVGGTGMGARQKADEGAGIDTLGSTNFALGNWRWQVVPLPEGQVLLIVRILPVAAETDAASKESEATQSGPKAAETTETAP
ncbi:MAG TPA: anti-sigma factor [Phycisphaerae bacterium]|nr:anti-sigma factor [Phycisphaerae bacterium]